MEEFDLSAEELSKAMLVIRRASPGRYTLKKLYGSDWLNISSPTTFGGRFAAAVRKGLLSGIIALETNTANHMVYEVHPR